MPRTEYENLEWMNDEIKCSMLQVVYYVKLRAHCQFIDNHVALICCIYINVISFISWIKCSEIEMECPCSSLSLICSVCELCPKLVLCQFSLRTELQLCADNSCYNSLYTRIILHNFWEDRSKGEICCTLCTCISCSSLQSLFISQFKCKMIIY